MRQVLLSLVLDIKNNKQGNKGAAVSIQSVLSVGVLKWLKSTGMEEVQLRNLSWAKVLQPKKKVGPHPCSLFRPHGHRDIDIANNVAYCCVTL